MRIELKGNPTLNDLPITIVSIYFESGVVEYTVDGVGLRGINRGIHETFLPRLSFGDSGQQWDFKPNAKTEERPENADQTG